MFLTRRQKELYDYIQQQIRANGYAPTLQEIGAHFRLSSLATVHKHLKNLEEKGLIKRKWNYSRAIELPEEEQARAVSLPLLGRVAAGRPIEAIEDPSQQIAVPEEFLRGKNTYVLRVAGNSMIEDGILDGDYVVVEERPTADDGQTVVATVDGEATVKRLYREKGGKYRLQPANQGMKPIVVSGSQLAIRGVVVAVMRKY